MLKYVMMAILSGILSAFSQVLLKKSSKTQRSGIISEYFNKYVVSGYIITFICMVIMIYAYKGMPFKYGAILESLVYLYVMILSRCFFGEKITSRRFIGNWIIIVGVIIFSI